MRRRLAVSMLGLGLVLALACAFADEADPVWALLQHAGSTRDLRAALLDFAAEARDSARAGEAEYWCGVSFERDGIADSALACYTRAVELRGAAEERDAMAEALFARNAPGDAARARAILMPGLERARATSDVGVTATEARIAWSFYFEGKADTAERVFTRHERRLLDPQAAMNREWRYRMAAVSLAAGDPKRAGTLLFPLAVASRLQDRDVMAMLEEATGRAGGSQHLAIMLRKELALADRKEREILDELRARRVRFQSSDGFPISGTVMAAPGSARRRAVVIVSDAEELAEDYDSLGAGLIRGGYALILLHPRGSGGSVAPSCPLPESWRGRESEMIARCAGDVRLALRALAAASRVDTSSYVIGASRSAAAIGIEAARLDPRVRALLLLSPTPSPVDLGPLAARHGALRRPVFFQVAPADFAVRDPVEVLYHAGDERASRVSDSDRIGRGPTVFRQDPRLMPRLLLWLRESWPPRSVRSAPPRAAPRKR